MHVLPVSEELRQEDHTDAHRFNISLGKRVIVRPRSQNKKGKKGGKGRRQEGEREGGKKREGGKRR